VQIYKNTNMSEYIEIKLHPEDKAQLKKQFGCSRQTVTMALKDFVKSKLSREIRTAALEMIEENIKAVKQSTENQNASTASTETQKA